MATEQGLYAQFVMLCRKDLKIPKANKNKNEATSKFLGQYARPQRWSDLDFDWIEEDFSAREPGFYTNIFQTNDKTKYTNTF